MSLLNIHMLQSSNADFCIRILCKIRALSEGYTWLMKDYWLKDMKKLAKVSQLQTFLQPSNCISAFFSPEIVAALHSPSKSLHWQSDRRIQEGLVISDLMKASDKCHMLELFPMKSIVEYSTSIQKTLHTFGWHYTRLAGTNNQLSNSSFTHSVWKRHKG